MLQTRFVVLTWEHWINPHSPDDYGQYTPKVSVSGFTEGTYYGSISNAGAYEITMVVGTDGTGTWTSGDAVSVNSFPFVATVDGISSASASAICGAI